MTTTERAEALRVRAEWMALMRFHPKEIHTACSDESEPVSLAEELENLQAAHDLRLEALPVALAHTVDQV